MPFTHRGQRDGLWGDTGDPALLLVLKQMRLVQHNRPYEVVLKNSHLLAMYDGGNFRKALEVPSKRWGYRVYLKLMSAHEDGVPTKWKRLLMVAMHEHLTDKEFVWLVKGTMMSLELFLDVREKGGTQLKRPKTEGGDSLVGRGRIEAAGGNLATLDWGPV